jgi:hypothetical protein
LNSLSRSPRVLRSWLLLLSALQIVTILVALERPAQAYVDPGSGFVFLQVVGSMAAGAVYYMRHRLRRVLHLVRRTTPIVSSAGSQTEVVENQP